jgi:8-amino-7-oxononanoate synthase
VVDFTSSLYLGRDHPSASIRPWQRLTTGAPAALVEPQSATGVARDLAALIGGARAVVMASTLHLFVDLFTNSLPQAALFWDEALYPVASWGIELAAARGAPATALPHLGHPINDRWIRSRTPRGLRPVIVTDGFCTGCGRQAPLRRYVEAVRGLGGLVVVDDTQALGLFGARPSPGAPFGVGGGGSLRRHGLEHAPVVVGASLAKAFGVPLAVLVGPAAVISAWLNTSETRVHTSPPSAPIIAAAKAALVHTRRYGASLRSALARRIAAFRRGLGELGLEATGGLFPVQSIALSEVDGDDETMQAHHALAVCGVRTVVSRPECRRRRLLTFVIRADHRWTQLAYTLQVLGATLRPRHRGRIPAYPPRELSTGVSQ